MCEHLANSVFYEHCLRDMGTKKIYLNLLLFQRPHWPRRAHTCPGSLQGHENGLGPGRPFTGWWLFSVCRSGVDEESFMPHLELGPGSLHSTGGHVILLGSSKWSLSVCEAKTWQITSITLKSYFGIQPLAINNSHMHMDLDNIWSIRVLFCFSISNSKDKS